MANRTAKEAKIIHGTNPQYLIEKIIRTRIYESRYWKEQCFGLSAADVFDRAIELRFIGGTYGGNIKPTPFLCLILKMLQIQPDMDIIIHFIGKIGEKYKYVRALGAYYLRLTASSLENWKYLEPLYNDFRKLRIMDKMGLFSVIHVDEFIDMLLRDERVFDVILPRVSKRRVHEEANELDPRISALEQDINDLENESDSEPEDKAVNKEKDGGKKLKDKHRKEKKDRDETSGTQRHEAKDGDRETKKHRDKERDKRESRRRTRSRSPSPYRGRRESDRRSHGDRDRDHRHSSSRRQRSPSPDRRRR